MYCIVYYSNILFTTFTLNSNPNSCNMKWKGNQMQNSTHYFHNRNFKSYLILNSIHNFQVFLTKNWGHVYIFLDIKYGILERCKKSSKTVPNSRFKRVPHSRFNRVLHSRLKRVLHWRFKRVPHLRFKRAPHLRFRRALHSKFKSVPNSKFKMVPHLRFKRILD